MSDQAPTRPTISELAAQMAATPGAPPAAAIAPDLARQAHENAKVALARIQGLTSQLEQTAQNLSTEEVMAGEGNLGWYAHEVAAQTAALRGAFAQLEADHEDLKAWLVSQGVTFRPLP